MCRFMLLLSYQEVCGHSYGEVVNLLSIICVEYLFPFTPVQKL